MRPPPLVLLKMKRKVGKVGSIPHPLMGSNYTKTMQNFAYTSFSSVMFVRNVLGVGNWQVFYV